MDHVASTLIINGEKQQLKRYYYILLSIAGFYVTHTVKQSKQTRY